MKTLSYQLSHYIYGDFIIHEFHVEMPETFIDDTYETISSTVVRPDKFHDDNNAAL